MARHQQFIKNAGVIGFGQVLSQGLILVRNVIVARMLLPADMGVAATFVLTVSLLEMASDLNIGFLLVQSKDGNDPRFLATSHTLNFLRGVLLSAIMFGLAWPFSSLFNVPQALRAFQFLALVPLIRGLLHQDTKRLQRHMRFGSNVATEVISQLIPTLVAWPLTFWLKDYSAMLWLVIIQSAVQVVISHLTAEQKFRCGWHKQYGIRMLTFGLPLLANGFLMFFMFQGDRLIVGAVFTMQDLGPYALAMNIALMTSSLLMTILGSLCLPVLSKSQDAPTQFARRYIAMMQVYSLFGAAVGIMFTLTGGWILALLYGSKYEAAGLYIGWMGITQAIRLIRAGPITAGLALADPYNSLVTNLFTLLGPAAALVAALRGGDLKMIAAMGVIGELSGLIAVLIHLKMYRGHIVPVRSTFKPLAVALGGIVISGFIAVTGVPQRNWPLAIAAATGMMGLTTLVMYMLFPGFRHDFRTILATMTKLKLSPPAIKTTGLSDFE